MTQTPGEVFLSPYNPEWNAEFDRLSAFLYRLLEDVDIDIQHVGSTAVPGLCAKPVLDIDVIIGNEEDLRRISGMLTAVGYEDKGEQGIPGRFAFRQASVHTPLTPNHWSWQTHHLYVCYRDCLALKNHLRFRDALLRDKALVAEYARLKMRLAREAGMTRQMYWVRKTDFILSVLASEGFDDSELDDVRKANQ
jgi:GrpB-like predicted nucleotidyltransferase (UPF0157 family)